MNLPDFDVFMQSMDTSVLKKAARHFADAFPDNYEYASLEETIKKYNYCNSRAFGEIMNLTLRAYHEWLQIQLQNQ